MIYRNDDIPFFVALLDVPVRLGHLFQLIAPIYDRFYLSCLDQPFK
jgi:hypothetical protein